jgi:hypothetical protein
MLAAGELNRQPTYFIKQYYLIHSVGFRSHACELAKLFAQVTMAVESTQKSDLHDGSIALLQQLLCSFNSLLEQILIRKCTDRLLKHVAD